MFFSPTVSIGALGALLLSLLVWYGYVHSLRLSISCTELALLPNNTFPPHGALTIVQLSDFHASANEVHLPQSLLREALHQANQSQPDLILLTGDFIDYDPQSMEYLRQSLLALRARLGVFAVLGNHDDKAVHLSAKVRVRAVLEECGVRVLENEALAFVGDLTGRKSSSSTKSPTNQSDSLWRTVLPGSEFDPATKFYLVGLGDPYRGYFAPEQVLPHLPQQENIPTLVMSHNPDTAARLARYRVDLQLSGHSHGGQIRLPFVGPLLPYFGRLFDTFPVLATLNKTTQTIWRQAHTVNNWTWASGLHNVPRTTDEQQPLDQDTPCNRLYTNRGLGTHPPLRLFCEPELSYFRLTNHNNKRRPI